LGQQSALGEIAWGFIPEFSRQGSAVLVAQDGTARRASRTESTTVFRGQSFPTNSRTSPTGDRIAFLDTNSLKVTQDETSQQLQAASDRETIQPQFAWSRSGDMLAYIVTRSGFDPELWLTDTTNNKSTIIAKGQGLEQFANLDWSPDDAHIIFTRTPSGSSVAIKSEIWRARTDGSELIALTNNDSQESLPQYSPDGTEIAFLRDGDLWVAELDASGHLRSDTNGQPPVVPDYKTSRSRESQRLAPATIRVRHDAANSCRSVPIGQIDVLDFETYVKRVVPSEVYPTWDDDALKTQAVAARTYAWFWILQNSQNSFDVTDTTAYQYMCETRYASTDSATDATRGQYLDYSGFMVFAAYGAENGDPTLTNSWGNPYLLGVDDPVGFMRARAGNGIGFSQWGAQRWATQYDWEYQQILRHYYSNVTVEAAGGGGNDTTPPLGAIVSPWNNFGVTSNRIHLVINASDDLSGINRIELHAQYHAAGPRNEILATLYGAQREFVWNLTALPNQTNIRVTPITYDNNGNSHVGKGITFNLDRKLPQGTLTAPPSTTHQTITLQLTGSDGGGSGLAGMLFSNNWEWQGENQFIEPNSASVVADPNALNGSALRGLFNSNPAGAWYGPYTTVLPQNRAYRAYFRLKTDNPANTSELALLDVVTDGGATVLGLKRIRGVDFASANEYQEFFVDFYYTGYSTNPPEFRVAYRAAASLWLDRILVTTYPVPFASSQQWKLSDGQGSKRIVGKLLDGAGNVSFDLVSNTFFGENPPPALIPRSWLPLILGGSP
jgi:hypothetical protein